MARRLDAAARDTAASRREADEARAEAAALRVEVEDLGARLSQAEIGAAAAVVAAVRAADCGQWPAPAGADLSPRRGYGCKLRAPAAVAPWAVPR